MQASNVDDTPVYNLSMERTLGTSDYRLPKLRTLEAVSKSIVLSKTAELRGKTDVSFRSFRKEAEKKKEIDLKWSEKMKEKFKKGIDEKMVKGEVKERKRLAMLEELKKHGGPCTSAEQVEDLVKKHSHDDASQELLTKRLKMEMKFARDSSTSLPKVDPIFRIQVTLPNKKRRDKNASEFAEALMSYLGKKEGKDVIDFKLFSESLDKCVKFKQ